MAAEPPTAIAEVTSNVAVVVPDEEECVLWIVIVLVVY
jgi:hypothetical protein